jgi:hypothetical protein
VGQRPATHGQQDQQDDGTEPELTKDYLDGAESTKGKLDEQKSGAPQDREEIEAKQARPADRAVLR